MDTELLYKKRFSEAEMGRKNKIWQVLCNNYFQRFVKPSDTVLDLGAGYCEFINNIRCRQKIAVDLNRDICHYADKDVKIFPANSAGLDFIGDESVDVVFASNLFEHFDSREEIIRALQEIRRVIRPGGIAMILQPNIRFAYRGYWDFFDHKIPLSDRSLSEALSLADLHCIKIIPRFLPYTTKSIGSAMAPVIMPLVRIYLHIPLLWRMFGKQMFIIAQK